MNTQTMNYYIQSIRSFIASRSYLWILIFLLFLPAILVKTHRGLPYIVSGDEPHYLVQINSLLRDHDFDLRNNYQSVHEGSDQAGIAFMGMPLDHHSVFLKEGKLYPWYEVYERSTWKLSPLGRPEPIALPGIKSDFTNQPEWSAHPPGLSLLLFPILTITNFLQIPTESAAIFITTIVIFMAAIFYLLTLKQIQPTTPQITQHVILAFTFLCTPIWHYTRALFTEPYLLFFIVLAIFLQKKLTVSTWILALGSAMKPTLLFFIYPLANTSTGLKKALLFLPIFISIFFLLFFQWKIYGSPWNSPQPLRFGNPIFGFAGLLFSPKQGLFIFSPILIWALWGWRKLYSKKEWRPWAQGAILYFLFMCAWFDWRGGLSYGPRLILPLIPILSLGFLEISFSKFSSTQKAAFLFCLALSFITNAVGAFLYTASWGRHPLFF